MINIQQVPVLILGSGVAGLNTAVELKRRGIESLIIEKGLVIGGRVSTLYCKAVTHCTHCGVCRLGDLFISIEKNFSNIKILNLATLVAAKKREDNIWRVDFIPKISNKIEKSKLIFSWSTPLTASLTVFTQIIILAVGGVPFNPQERNKVSYNYGSKVITSLELEDFLKLGKMSSSIKQVGFIQCVGSRDEVLGQGYCSQTCCGYSLRLAQLLIASYTDVTVTFFYMDIQNNEGLLKEKYRRSDVKLRFIRTKPSKIITNEDGVGVLYVEESGAIKIEQFDLIVFIIGLTPAKDFNQLVNIFSLVRNRDGFLNTKTNFDNTIFITGTAKGPMSIIETCIDASKVASEVTAKLDLFNKN